MKNMMYLASFLFRTAIGKPKAKFEDHLAFYIYEESLSIIAQAKPFFAIRRLDILCRIFYKNNVIMFSMNMAILNNEINDFVKNICIKSYRSDKEDYDMDKCSVIFDKILYENRNKQKPMRLLTNTYHNSLNECEKMEMLWYCCEMLYYITVQSGDMIEYIELIYVYLVMIKTIAGETKKIDYFFMSVSNVIDIASKTHNYQLARNLASEANLISIKWKSGHWGCFLQFQAFNIQYIETDASLQLVLLLKKVKMIHIPKELYISILLNIHRFYRNYGMLDFASDYYYKIQDYIKKDGPHYSALLLSHLQVKFTRKDVSTIYELNTFMENSYNDIFRYNIQRALAWLTLIYNVEKYFPFNIGIVQLQRYKKVFESIVPPSETERIIATVKGVGEKLEEYYIEYIIAHKKTYYNTDLAGELRNTIGFADNMIKKSFENNNANMFLLAMISKADMKHNNEQIRQRKDAEAIEVIKVNQNQKDYYKNYSVLVKNTLSNYPKKSFLWMASVESDVYVMLFESGNYSTIKKLNYYTLQEQNKWIEHELFNMKFSDKIRVCNQFYDYDEYYQAKDCYSIKEKTSFACLDLEISNDLVIFRDLYLSAMPHNLLMTRKGKYIIEDSGIIDSLTLQRIMKQPTYDNVIVQNKISLWNPIEGNDYTLHLLNSKLEPLYAKYSIRNFTKIFPKKPISDDIVFICAHGRIGIKNNHVIFVDDDKLIIDYKQIVKKAEVIILFVCYSGGGEKDLLKYKYNSFIGGILENCAKTVIAPAWALNISIIPVWMDAFLIAFSNNDIMQAVRIANMAVLEINRNPVAWCCMHCYGQPNIILAKADDNQN